MDNSRINTHAFLGMLALSEGTYFIGDRGYNCLVGSTIGNPKLFHSYADHPRISVVLRSGPPDKRLVSTAAGRYQILTRIYDFYKAQLKLPDFSPASQDAIALQLIRERGALEDVEAGRASIAIDKCRKAWASLPGAGYGQHEQRMSRLLLWFVQQGGVLA